MVMCLLRIKVPPQMLCLSQAPLLIFDLWAVANQVSRAASQMGPSLPSLAQMSQGDLLVYWATWETSLKYLYETLIRASSYERTLKLF